MFLFYQFKNQWNGDWEDWSWLLFGLPLIWFLAVIASFPIVYLKLPSDLFLNALANLGVGWARRWINFVKRSSIGKLLELSPQTDTQIRVMRLFEQLGEALPQLGLNNLGLTTCMV